MVGRNEGSIASKQVSHNRLYSLRVDHSVVSRRCCLLPSVEKDGSLATERVLREAMLWADDGE